jgi:hypothetical protein
MRRPAVALAVASITGSAAGAPLHELCDAMPPAVEVRVLFAPAAAQIDDSKGSREIKLDEERGAAYRHLGVTRATMQRDLDVRLEGYTDERSGRACAWPKVTLRLSVRPLVVELARELEGSECMRAHVLEHEMLHVAIYNAGSLRASQQLEREMRAHFSGRPLDGDAGTLLREVQEQINQRWLVRLDELVADANREHDALDAAEERQAYTVCNGALTQILKSIK